MKATEGNVFGKNAAARILDMFLFQEPETYVFEDTHFHKEYERGNS